MIKIQNTCTVHKADQTVLDYRASSKSLMLYPHVTLIAFLWYGSVVQASKLTLSNVF